MCAICGPGQTLLYQAAYVPFIATRHPASLGQPLCDVWADIGPLVARVMGGDAVSSADMPLLITRSGDAEETWRSFAYSPLCNEGQIVGLLNIATATTAGVVAARERDAAQTQLMQGRLLARRRRGEVFCKESPSTVRLSSLPQDHLP